MKKIEVVSEDVETLFEAVVENEDEGDRTAADFADAAPTSNEVYDNAFNGAHVLLYRRGLDERYGSGTADALEERYRDSHFKGKITKEWSKREYEAKILEIKEKLANLNNGS